LSFGFLLWRDDCVQVKVFQREFVKKTLTGDGHSDVVQAFLQGLGGLRFARVFWLGIERSREAEVGV